MSEIKALRGLSILQHDFCMSDQCIERMDELADEIQAEVDSEWMRLPVDADGVPIRRGDEIVNEHGYSAVVTGVSETMFFHDSDTYTGLHRRCFACGYTHRKPRTIEDVLEDFYSETVSATTEEREAMVDKYADEIRELLGVEE